MDYNLHVDSMQQIRHKSFEQNPCFNKHFGEEVPKAAEQPFSGQRGSTVYEVKPDCGSLYVASSAWVVC